MIKNITKVDGDLFLSVGEASKELGVKENAIRNYLYEGKMTTYKFKGLTLVSKAEIEAWKPRQK